MNAPIQDEKTRKTKIANICRWLMYMNPVVLDTETTGFDQNSEVVEIAIVEAKNKNVLMNQLINPMAPIPEKVSKINHITGELLKDEMTMKAHWFSIHDYLEGRVVVAYNAAFDMRLLAQSAEMWNMDTTIQWLGVFDLMQLYAEFQGKWNAKRQSWQFIKLADAAEQCGLVGDTNYHRALADTLVTRDLLAYLAGWKYE